VKKTVFHHKHLELGAKMVLYAGFEMPVEYSGVRHEHRNVREKAGVFDVSHMGEIWIRGPGAFSLAQRLTSNDVRKLVPGSIHYTCFPNEKGGIVDDLLVYRYSEETYLLVVNAANREKDHQWILAHNREHATVEDASDEISMLAVQGPLATSLLQQLTAVDLSQVPYYHFVTGELAGIKEVIISHTGYTGAGGFELYVYNRDGNQLWDRLFEAGKKMGLEPAGLAARDTLRLEMGYCLYGNDIDETTSPIEAGLGWITRFVEGNPFINRDALERQKKEGVSRRLVGFELQERGIPRQHYPILNQAGDFIGEVTSGTMSPMLDRGIGMGYVTVPFDSPGSGILIAIRNKRIPAVVVKMPFYKGGQI
jgi:aminomethyltransferase